LWFHVVVFGGIAGGLVKRAAESLSLSLTDATTPHTRPTADEDGSDILMQ
jgi:hypothetical protein